MILPTIFPSLAFSAVIYTATNIISRAIPFVLLPVLTRFLSPDDYGIVSMFQVILGMLVSIVGLSVHGAIGRQYFEKNTIDFPAYLTNCFYILGVSGTVTGIALWFFSDLIAKFTQFPVDWLWAVLVVALGQFVAMIMLILCQVQMQPLAYGIFQILMTFTNIGLSIWFVVGLGFNWQGRVLAQVISSTIFAVAVFLILAKKGLVKWGYQKEYVRHALGFGIPLIPHEFGALVISMTDRVMITNLVGIADTGVFVVGAQVGMVIGVLQDSFNRAWVPWFYEQLKKTDNVANVKIVKITYVYNILILFGALALAYVAPWLLSFLVGKSFQGSSSFVIWIALGYAFNGMYKMVANYIFYIQKTHLLGMLTFLLASINIAVSYVLIKVNGAVGAAQGTMLAYFIAFALTWILSARLYKMPWRLTMGRCKSK